MGLMVAAKVVCRVICLLSTAPRMRAMLRDLDGDCYTVDLLTLLFSSAGPSQVVGGRQTTESTPPHESIATPQ
ncbi:uncharacterized protein P884DRAFT_252980 [Thermothelomyces heterothallicus CBS 202.75]|uniref:uncharacterized protein n=1 Tax=Thermothelomyces heterothallicus CBS 202.75 TaxID=1149848 RepID=UPI0037429E9C